MFVVFLHSSDPIPSKQYDAYMYFVDAVFGISYIYIYIEEQIVETDRTEWKTLSGNRA